jgi:hypothetical protein
MRNEPVPGFAGADVENDIAVLIVSAALVDALNRDFQRQARPTGIRDHKIATPSKNQQRQVARAGECNCLLHFTDIPGLDEIPRRASDLDSRERRERDVFKQMHE